MPAARDCLHVSWICFGISVGFFSLAAALAISTMTSAGSLGGALFATAAGFAATLGCMLDITRNLPKQPTSVDPICSQCKRGLVNTCRRPLLNLRCNSSPSRYARGSKAGVLASGGLRAASYAKYAGGGPLEASPAGPAVGFAATVGTQPLDCSQSVATSMQGAPRRSTAEIKCSKP